MVSILRLGDTLPPGVDARALLGGKAAGLFELISALQMPVPPGFVITTDVCRQYLRAGWPADLDDAIDRALATLERDMDARFGDPAAPLVVSVRSGAPVSMPGMMDTLLNVGMTPGVVAGLTKATGDADFAADCWFRFCKMFAEIVAGLPRDAVAAVAMSGASAPERTAAAERIQALARDAGSPIPLDPRDQLRAAIEAVFRSWTSDRARLFRAYEGIADDLGTAVTVQAMAFGNRDDRSGTGVVFTRNPSTGESTPYGDYLARAQGEDVVAGTHAVQGLSALHAQLPAVYDELLATLARIERHYRDMCDVEFTVSSGRLYVLQTRIGRRSPLAAARIAVEMANDAAFPIDRAEAVARVDSATLARLAESTHVEASARPLGTGLAASPGVGTGVLCTDPGRAADLAAAGTAVVLAREDTSPEDVHGMVNAAAIVTMRGGVVSHAAVVARSWSIPAITSLGEATVAGDGIVVGGLHVAEGETLTVDGTNGHLYRGDCRQQGEADVPWARVIREWAIELGVEPGTRREAAVEAGDATVPLFDLLRAIQLKGLCQPARAAAYLHATEAAVAARVDAEAALFKATARGLMLTPDGRARAEAGLAAERAAVGPALDPVYAEFLELNTGFKRLVTWWQTEGQAEPEANLGRLLEELHQLHDAFVPLITSSATAVPRLAAFAARFAHALAALEGGDASMLASPLKESYHTLWFDFHEELIALSGRNRADEET